MSIVNPCLGDKELIFNVDAGQCAVKKAGGTSNVAATSITPVGSIPAGMTFDEYFNQDREIMPDNGASKKSKKGYIVVYPLLDLPPKAKVT